MLTPVSLRKRKKRLTVTCPLCQGSQIELINKTSEEGYWKKEEYLCYSCDCEWDWTFQRPFLHPRLNMRPPKWVKIE
jgi:transposase-like protein